MSHHTISQLVHVIWSTDNLQFSIPFSTRTELYAYLSTVIKSHTGHLYLAGGSYDHIHCLLSLPPTMSLAGMMRLIKSHSSKWLKVKSGIDSQFSWQDGYIAFSVQNDRVDSTCKYILDEAVRHEKVGYRDELARLLRLQNIPFDEKLLLTSTYSKLLLHLIWSTKNRTGFLHESIRPALYTEMTTMLRKLGALLYSIGGIEDHLHILIEAPRTTALANIVQEIKTVTAHWLPSKSPAFCDFAWQTGYGAFSISYPTIEAVKQYIMNQEDHHKIISPEDEWNRFLLRKGVPVPV